MTADSARMDLPPQKDLSKGDVGDRLSFGAMPTEDTKARRARLGRILEKLRTDADLSQTEAGALAGIHQRVWSRMEKGGTSVEAMAPAFEALGHRLTMSVVKVTEK